MIGQTISHYKILEKLGEGGMGVVYKAQDIILDRPVALKVLSEQALINEDDKARFVREAQLAASLSHPNIATVYEFGEFEARSFLAMEFLEGVTLAKRIKDGPLPLDELLKTATEVSEGLSKAHEKGIVHRDMKSENIMITREGTNKIMDFGLAEMRGRSRITRIGTTLGTVSYMSPEQARGEELDERTDIWSFGVVLYEAATGHLPFPGSYESAILYLILHEQPETIRKQRADIPPGFEQIVLRCLKKEREERYQRVRGLLEDLETLRKEIEKGDSQSGPTAVPSQGVARKLESEKRSVTILFSSLMSGAMDSAEIDTENLSIGLNECFKGLISIVRRFEGTTDRIVGDKLMAVFGAPVAHENDPERAVRCGHEMISYIERFNSLGVVRTPSPLQLRVGIHSGTVIAGPVGTEGGAGYSVMGDAVNIAAGLAELAPATSVFISADVYKLVSNLVEVGEQRQVQIRGKSQAITVFMLRSLKAGVEPGRRIIGTGAFVGRQRELALLDGAVHRVAKKIESRIFVQGEAGVGKTRFKTELVQRAQQQGLSVCEGRCSSFEINTPYFLWNTFLKSLLRIGLDMPEGEIRLRLHETLQILSLEADEPYLATLLSMRYEEILMEVDEERKRRIFEAMQKLLKAYSDRRPALFIFEDLHWIDRFSQDLLEIVFTKETLGSALILCLYRPEYGRAAKIIGGGDVIDLDRLPGDEARQLMRLRFSVEEVPKALEDLIEQRAEGNPFFIEEIIKTLLDKNIVAVKKGKLEILAENVEAGVPETIQGVILARIDQLEEKIRDVLLDASVIGREFSRPVLEHMLQRKADVLSGLKKLESLELILEKEEAHELEYLFKHYLIQEVAYNTILANRRKKMHGLIAAAIERLYADRLKEFYELLAFHYEKAENWSKAAEYLSRAGQKAVEIFSKEESKDFQSRKEEAIAKLFESAGEKRLGWVILASLTAMIATPIAIVMLLVPYLIGYMVWHLPPYIRFELWGSGILGNVAFFLYLSIVLLGYPWAGLVFTFLGILPVFKGSPKLFDLLDDQIRVVFRSGKIHSIHFSEIEHMRFFDRKAKRRWKHRIIDPLYRMHDYSKLTWKTWLKEVAGDILPPFSFGFGSTIGEIHLTRKTGRRQLRLLFPWLNTATKSRTLGLTPSDPKGFYEQLETAYKKWQSKSRGIQLH